MQSHTCSHVHNTIRTVVGLNNHINEQAKLKLNLYKLKDTIKKKIEKYNMTSINFC